MQLKESNISNEKLPKNVFKVFVVVSFRERFAKLTHTTKKSNDPILSGSYVQIALFFSSSNHQSHIKKQN